MGDLRVYTRPIGIMIGLIAIYFEIVSHGINVIVYLTCWNLALNTLTLLGLYFDILNFRVGTTLKVLGWVVGFSVTLIFWGNIYPAVEDKSILPSFYVLTLDHGVLTLFFIPEILDSRHEFNSDDFKRTIIFMALYVFGVLAPLAFYDVIVYPGMTFKNSLTYILGAANVAILYFAFKLGAFLRKQFPLNKRAPFVFKKLRKD